MKLSILALVGALILAAPSARAAETDPGVMAAVNGFVEATMTGKPLGPLFTASPSILDEFAPYSWISPKAADAWFADFGAMLQKEGITDAVVKLGAPVRVEATAAHAYVVAPAIYTFKLKGTAMRADAMTAFALDKTPAGWKIAAFSWAGPPAHP